MGLWDFLGIASKHDVDKLNDMLIEMNIRISEFQEQQTKILSCMENNSQRIEECIINSKVQSDGAHHDIVNKIISLQEKAQDSHEVITESHVLNQQIDQKIIQLTQSEITSMNNLLAILKSDFQDTESNMKNMQCVLMTHIYDAIHGLMDSLEKHNGITLQRIEELSQYTQRLMTLEAEQTQTLQSDCETMNKQLLESIHERTDIINKNFETIHNKSYADIIAKLHDIKGILTGLKSGEFQILVKDIGLIEELFRFAILNNLIGKAEDIQASTKKD